MDSNSPINNKRQKHHDGQAQNQSNATIMDDLPEDILREIIFGIPRKEIVATSVLSKRWKNRWIGLYKYAMELDEREFEKRQDFINFAEKLHVVCDQSSLKNFTLLFEVGKEFTRVIRWLHVFVNPTIVKLSLKLDRVQKPLVLPNQFFTSEKLVKFQINMRQVIKFPSTINFENLVILTFSHVIFPNRHRTQIFFMGLPSLRELTLIQCDWRKVGSITITCEALRELFIREWKEEEEVNANDNDDDDKDRNEKEKEEDKDVAEEDENVDDHGEIEFIAPKLVVFSYVGDLMNYYFLLNTTSVTDASIEVDVNQNKDLHTDYFVSKLIPNFFRVQTLSISDFVLTVLSQVPDFGVHFYHLAVLRVVSTFSINLSYPGFRKLLQSSPFLQEIEFDVELTDGVYLDENDGNVMNPLPECFETTLKIIKIQDFYGSPEQLSAIKFLLEKALVLNTLYIYISGHHFNPLEEEEQINSLYLHILSFPKASLDCIIHLE